MGKRKAKDGFFEDVLELVDIYSDEESVELLSSRLMILAAELAFENSLTTEDAKDFLEKTFVFVIDKFKGVYESY